jgi:hypothetical protein
MTARRLRTIRPASPYPKPPRELAGKWVAWSQYQIVFSADKLDDVMDWVERQGIKGVSYERLPTSDRGHSH